MHKGTAIGLVFCILVAGTLGFAADPSDVNQVTHSSSGEQPQVTEQFPPKSGSSTFRAGEFAKNIQLIGLQVKTLDKDCLYKWQGKIKNNHNVSYSSKKLLIVYWKQIGAQNKWRKLSSKPVGLLKAGEEKILESAIPYEPEIMAFRLTLEFDGKQLDERIARVPVGNIPMHCRGKSNQRIE